MERMNESMNEKKNEWKHECDYEQDIVWMRKNMNERLKEDK